VTVHNSTKLVHVAVMLACVVLSVSVPAFRELSYSLVAWSRFKGPSRIRVYKIIAKWSAEATV